MSEEDFNRSESSASGASWQPPEPLWEPARSLGMQISVGVGPNLDDRGITVYGQDNGNGWPQARMTAATVCTSCRKPIQAGHVVTAKLAIPPEQGSWHHTDCADPKLEQEIP